MVFRAVEFRVLVPEDPMGIRTVGGIIGGMKCQFMLTPRSRENNVRALTAIRMGMSAMLQLEGMERVWGER
eukprot:7909832-Alexandrium_andersonii.AAC.1